MFYQIKFEDGYSMNKKINKLGLEDEINDEMGSNRLLKRVSDVVMQESKRVDGDIHVCHLGNIASIHMQRWANYFAEHGWRVDLITWHPIDSKIEQERGLRRILDILIHRILVPPRYPPPKMHPNVIVHRIFFPPHYIARYGALLEITRLIRKIRPDIIHAHNIGTFGILAGLYARVSEFRPIVLTTWGSDILIDAKSLWKGGLIKYALEKADCIIYGGEHLVEVLTGLGADPQKFRLTYFGVDIRKFNPEQRNEKIRKELELFDSPMIISLRNLLPLYDVESLIRSIPSVLNEFPEAKFVIAGEGAQKAELEELAKSLEVLDSARFVGGIPYDKLPEYLASADIYVSTSLSDGGIATSTLEAMACGLPVIITDFGDNRKWVNDGVNGFIVPLRSPESLASKIVYLLHNNDYMHKFGQRNRQIVEERANWEKEMKKMENLYIELIERYKS